METAAYYIALLMVVMTPPGILVWLLVHPFAEQWRRIGPYRTYFYLSLFIILCMALIHSQRELLLRIHYGVKALLLAAAVILFAGALYIGYLLRKHLSISAMLGLPELSPPVARRLITEGIYQKIRHPRYVEVGLGLAAAALFSNYLACYIVFALYLPVIFFVILLEEQELRKRFGRSYEEYCRQVPRFIPRFK